MSLPARTQGRVPGPQFDYAGQLKDFSLWDDNKENLKRLYLEEDRTVKDVKERMEEEHGFPTFKQVADIMPGAPNIPITPELAVTNFSGPMALSSSLGGSLDFAWLSQACYYLSNNLDEESRFTLLLLRWIGHSADIRLLERFFLIRSTTIMAVWDLLYNSSISLKQHKAYVILVNIGLSIKNGEWVARRPCLIDAAKMQATDTVKRLLEFGKTSYPPITCDQVGDILEYNQHSYNMEYITVCPLTVASVNCDLETMRVLLKYHANANLTDDQKKRNMLAPICGPLKSLSRPDNPPRLDSALDCIKVLLEAGASVDIDWPGDQTRHGFPFCLTDYIWLYFRETEQLVDMISRKSMRTQSHVTVAGIFLSASNGLVSLQQYLAGRKYPDGDDRADLLQVALSEGATHGLIRGVTSLLDLGVDPNFDYLRGWHLPDHHNFLSWNPARRAAQVGCSDIVMLLKKRNARIQPYHIIRDYFYFHGYFGNMKPVRDDIGPMKTALSLAEIFRDEIKSAGPSLIFASLRSACRQNLEICVTLCENIWSWGAPLHIEYAGRDALHYAISRGCCFGMVQYLVDRGYGVHSELVAYHPIKAEEMRLPACSRVSMLGDALIGLSEDKLEIVDFLIKRHANTENVHEHFTLLESTLLYGRIGHWTEQTVSCSLKIFNKLFSAGASVHRSPHRVFPLPYGSILSGLIESNADDLLIHRVIDAIKDIR
ncbi:hypothetical protein O1611_g290 [Lasiodiplodia mahajangana]|uniref:Uncharacterized protein n=1 Tax=Lasiodiplodia mahajangana TaxID=1108764 RepID=A0ACC2K177_9PEZI|nr:hypothetical protein O1611_g290 [Lasiodiplodia mahajangana]